IDTESDLPKRLRLEQEAQFIDVVDVSFRQRWNDKTASQSVEQALAGKPAKCFSDGSARYAKLRGEGRFLKRLSAWQSSRTDMLAQGLIDAISQRLGPINCTQ